MPEDSSSRGPGLDPSKKKAKSVSNQIAIAMELPFTLVGAVIAGGLLGYVLDLWLHTGPWLMMVLGALGFFAGVREVVRRLPLDKNGKGNGPKPG